MKKGRLLHIGLSEVIASMGHTDTIIIADAGMPCPEGAYLIDLALCPGQVAFLDVLRVVLEDLEVQGAYIAKEMDQVSPRMKEEILGLLPKDIDIHEIDHEDVKKRSEDTRAFIRTGEFTAYANIILESGVLF